MTCEGNHQRQNQTEFISSQVDVLLGLDLFIVFFPFSVLVLDDQNPNILEISEGSDEFGVIGDLAIVIHKE